jgi:hypothetical protein
MAGSYWKYGEKFIFRSRDPLSDFKYPYNMGGEFPNRSSFWLNEMLPGAVEAAGVGLAAVAPLLAIGLFNTLNGQAEEALDRRNALLEGLRQLSRNRGCPAGAGDGTRTRDVQLGKTTVKMEHRKLELDECKKPLRS